MSKFSEENPGGQSPEGEISGSGNTVNYNSGTDRSGNDNTITGDRSATANSGTANSGTANSGTANSGTANSGTENPLIESWNTESSLQNFSAGYSTPIAGSKTRVYKGRIALALALLAIVGSISYAGGYLVSENQHPQSLVDQAIARVSSGDPHSPT